MVGDETLRVIKQRRSIRSYREEQVKEEELQAVVEAGLYAPNAGGQAWHFTVVQNRALLDRLSLAAKEGARNHVSEHLRALGNDEEFHCLYGAPVLVIVSADGRAPMPLDADCAAALENILLAAEAVGLGSCWIFFVLLAFLSDHGAALLKELKIPEGYRPYCAAVLGYKRDPAGEAPDRKPNLITYIK